MPPTPFLVSPGLGEWRGGELTLPRHAVPAHLATPKCTASKKSIAGELVPAKRCRTNGLWGTCPQDAPNPRRLKPRLRACGHQVPLQGLPTHVGAPLATRANGWRMWVGGTRAGGFGGRRPLGATLVACGGGTTRPPGAYCKTASAAVFWMMASPCRWMIFQPSASRRYICVTRSAVGRASSWPSTRVSPRSTQTL